MILSAHFWPPFKNNEPVQLVDQVNIDKAMKQRLTKSIGKHKLVQAGCRWTWNFLGNLFCCRSCRCGCFQIQKHPTIWTWCVNGWWCWWHNLCTRWIGISLFAGSQHHPLDFPSIDGLQHKTKTWRSSFWNQKTKQHLTKMKLELNVPSSQVAAIETIIKVICSNETGKQLSVESCLDDSKLMGFVSSEFVKRIVLWSKKVDSLAKLKAKNKS